MKGHSFFISSRRMTDGLQRLEAIPFSLISRPSWETVCLFLRRLFGLPLVPSSPPPNPLGQLKSPKAEVCSAPGHLSNSCCLLLQRRSLRRAFVCMNAARPGVLSSNIRVSSTENSWNLCSWKHPSRALPEKKKKSKRYTSPPRVNNLCKSDIWDSSARGQMKQQFLGHVRQCLGQFSWDNAKDTEWGGGAELFGSHEHPLACSRRP